MKKIFIIFIIFSSKSLCFSCFNKEKIEKIRNTPCEWTSIKEAEKYEQNMRIFDPEYILKELFLPSPIYLFSKMQLKNGIIFTLSGYTPFSYAKKTNDYWKLTKYSTNGISLLDRKAAREEDLFAQYWKFQTIQPGLFEIVFARPSGEEIRIEVEVQ